jgi:glycosyltransferase involved in cell wall biosynthesis
LGASWYLVSIHDMSSPIASVSLVVRTYNEERYLDRVLAAARSCGPLLTEIVVVDSGSNDATLDIAKAHGAKIVSIEKADFSFGRSLNLGCAESRGEVVVFLSGHCIPADESWLANLLQPFSDPQVAGVYGRQIGGDGTKFSEVRVFEKYYPPNERSQGVAFCNNANAALRKSIWNRFKFDEQLTGLEDIALGKKLTEVGFRIAYAPQANVMHLHHETWAQVRRRYEREAIALRHINPGLHLSLLEAGACCVLACFFDLCAAIKMPGGIFRLPEIVLYRLHQFAGSWRGSRAHRELGAREKITYFFPS